MHDDHHVRTPRRRCQAKKVAQDTEKKHGMLLVVVLAKHGGCLSSVDRDRGLRIWSEREARRLECETRLTAYLERARSSTERVRDSLLVGVGTSEELVTGVIPKSQIFLGCWS